MKECDKRKSHISSNFMWSIYLLIMLDTLLLGLPLHFAQLHFTCRHVTSFRLNFTQLHFTTISFGLTLFKFPTAPFHLTLLHFTSLHLTFRRFSPHFYSFNFTPFIIAFLTLFLKILGLRYTECNLIQSTYCRRWWRRSN